MEFRTLKKLFEDGLLSSAVAVPAPLKPDCWNLLFVNVSGNTEKMTLARSSEIKLYKALNGALSDAQKIGFRSITVEFDKMAT